jgi:hypothetical protein
MTNHIGKSMCENPVEWALIIILVTVCLTMATVALNRPDPVCVVEAVPVEDSNG